MIQPPQRLRLDLADTLSSHLELLADFFQRVVGVDAAAGKREIAPSTVSQTTSIPDNLACLPPRPAVPHFPPTPPVDFEDQRDFR